MPLYVYACRHCGSFEAFRPVADASSPARCPECRAPARRAFTPPGLALLARPTRRALELEERSAHEPQVVREKRGRPMPHVHTPSPPWVLSH